MKYSRCNLRKNGWKSDLRDWFNNKEFIYFFNEESKKEEKVKI